MSKNDTKSGKGQASGKKGGGKGSGSFIIKTRTEKIGKKK